MRGNILILEDEEDWRETLQLLLVREQYFVEVAANPEEAEKLLDKNYFHLAILDISMQKGDATDDGGLIFWDTIGKNRAGSEIKLLVITAYGNKERVKMAFRDFSAVDFIDKSDFTGDVFVEQINQIFESIDINLDLEIHWKNLNPHEKAVNNLNLKGRRIKLDTPLHSRCFNELKDLLCRLFHDAQSIMVSPLIHGFSGAGVLRVEPFFEATPGEPVVVKFGDAQLIHDEYERYDRFVRNIIPYGRRPHADPVRETAFLGALKYSLIGTKVKSLRNFGLFYKNNGIEEIKEALKKLFFMTCGAWYTGRSPIAPYDLLKDYKGLLGFATRNLNNAKKLLSNVKGDKKLVFSNLTTGEEFANCIESIVEQQFLIPVYTCTTHGDLHENNILVDYEGNSWLIDFLRTGKGHILRDITLLDTIVRTQLLLPEEADLNERLQLEKALINIDYFTELDSLPQNLDSSNKALQKTYSICLYLRKLAHELIGRHATNDLQEFFIPCIYFGLNSIRFYSLPKIQREHALLSACVIAEKINK